MEAFSCFESEVQIEVNRSHHLVGQDPVLPGHGKSLNDSGNSGSVGALLGTGSNTLSEPFWIPLA